MIEKLSSALDLDPHELAQLLEKTVTKVTGGLKDTPETRLVIYACLTLIKEAVEQEPTVIRLFSAKKWLAEMEKSGSSPMLGLNPKLVAKWADIVGTNSVSEVTRVGPHFYNISGPVAVDSYIGDLMIEGYSLVTNVLTNIELAALTTVSPGGNA